jgi:predicted enzyme related to lactoylglutathione lyase
MTEPLRFLSGIILTSTDPARLAHFYRDVLGVPLTTEQHGDSAPHWACELGDIHFAIHAAADHPAEPTGAGAIKLAFMVFDLNALVASLSERGVALCYPPEDFGEESRITAIHDPDGNLIELTELGPSWLAHLRAHRSNDGDVVAHWSARKR